MSYFDDASLVMIPSGYKTSKVYSVKPTDGSGDLTFSRSNDTATRVNSAGLIEKVRTNIVTYSEDFANAAWSKGNASVTSNAIANPLNGALTADLVTATANVGYVSSTAFAFAAVPYTISMYAKKSNVDWVSIEASDGVANSSKSWYNIANGTLGTTGGTYTILNRTITSVGNGWYRLTLTFSVTVATNYSFVPFFVASDGALSVTGNAGYAFGTQVEISDFGATPYIATTSAAVSVGPVANVPRLDYLNSSCPRLLLEPQRTNLATYSEQFDNAAWTKSLCTISANASTSPDGYSNSDRITASAGTGIAQMYSAFSASAGAYTYSFFVKAGTHSQVFFGSYGTAAFGGAFTYRDMIFDIATGTITASAGNLSVSTQINNYGNGWYRVAVTYSATSNGTVTYILGLAKDTTTISGTWAGTENILGYGIQVEAGAYATSYIPTLGAAVTRGADAASKTSASALIGQTEGTLFAEFAYNGAANTGIYEVIILVATDTNNLIALIKNNTTSQLYAYAINGGVIQVNSVGIAGTNIIGTHKVAFAYKLNDYAVYLDGVQVFTDTTATVPACSGVYVGQSEISTQQLGGTISQALLFKTRLSNADLAALTA